MNGDPLKRGSSAEQELFQRLARLCDGLPPDAVQGAAMNLIINAIRQSTPKRTDAEARFSELTGRAAALLLDNHYDPVTGNRRTIFPFTQVVTMPFHIDDDKQRQ
jgi:acyl carrier protein phosphodiesterase